MTHNVVKVIAIALAACQLATRSSDAVYHMYDDMPVLYYGAIGRSWYLNEGMEPTELTINDARLFLPYAGTATQPIAIVLRNSKTLKTIGPQSWDFKTVYEEMYGPRSYELLGIRPRYKMERNPAGVITYTTVWNEIRQVVIENCPYLTTINEEAFAGMDSLESVILRATALGVFHAKLVSPRPMLKSIIIGDNSAEMEWDAPIKPDDVPKLSYFELVDTKAKGNDYAPFLSQFETQLKDDKSDLSIYFRPIYPKLNSVGSDVIDGLKCDALQKLWDTYLKPYEGRVVGMQWFDWSYKKFGMHCCRAPCFDDEKKMIIQKEL